MALKVTNPEATATEKKVEKISAPLVPLTKEEKLKAAASVSASLNKTYNAVLVQKLGKREIVRFPSISMNLPTVDEKVIGCGGLPRGRVIEVFGPESSGKTTFCLHAIGAAQKAGGVAAFVDAEHALDIGYAKKLGVNVDELLLSQPDYGEQALEVVLALVEGRCVDLVVIDSVSALVPKAELDGDMGDSHMGLHARLMSQAMRKLVGLVSKYGVTVIFINQVREKIGVMFGNPETTTGGRALKFFSSVRLEVRRVSKSDGGELKEGDTHIGHKMRVKNVKNKVGQPFNETALLLYYGQGFDQRADLVEYAIDLGVVQPGAWCVFKEQKYRKDQLTEDPIYDTLKVETMKVRDALFAEATAS
jgi:recombination protein RecA